MYDVCLFVNNKWTWELVPFDWCVREVIIRVEAGVLGNPVSSHHHRHGHTKTINGIVTNQILTRTGG